MKHETKSEFIKESNLVVKLLFFIGVIKLVEKEFTFNNKFRFGNKLRRVHPLTWLLFVFSLIVNGFNKQTIKDFKKSSIWW